MPRHSWVHTAPPVTPPPAPVPKPEAPPRSRDPWMRVDPPVAKARWLLRRKGWLR